MDNKIKEIMASVFDVEVSSIEDNVAFGRFEKWDSLNHMNLIVALEEEFGVSFNDDEVPELLSFKLIKNVLAEKKI